MSFSCHWENNEKTNVEKCLFSLDLICHSRLLWLRNLILSQIKNITHLVSTLCFLRMQPLAKRHIFFFFYLPFICHIQSKSKKTQNGCISDVIREFALDEKQTSWLRRKIERICVCVCVIDSSVLTEYNGVLWD